MPDKKNITCIICPKGCELTIVQKEDKIIITGNKCDKGKKYAQSQLNLQTRILTTSITVIDGELPLVSVRSTSEIPVEKITEIMCEIKSKKIKAPVKIGEKIIKKIADTKADIIATKNIKKKK